MSKLDDIFNENILESNGNEDTSKAKQQIKELFLELIGDDEVRPSEGPKRNGVDQGLRRARNKVRNELRKKVEEL